MRPETMRSAFLVLFAALIALFVVITWPFAKAAFLAFTLTVIFFPLHRLIIEKIHLPRYIASLATTLIVGVCVIFPLVVLCSVVVTQVDHFLQGVVSQVETGTLSVTLQTILTSIHDSINRLTGSAPTVEELQSEIITLFKEAGKKFYEFSPRVLSTTISVIVNFFLMLVFLFVFLAEGGKLYSWLMETSPLSADHQIELAHDIRLTLTSSIVAAIITAIAQGVLLGVGFRIAGFGEPYGWGLIAIILSIIPVVGAASCYITATIVLLSSGRPEAAVIFILFGFGVVSSIDNVIRPLIIRGTSRMHPLLLFVTLIGAVKLLGPIGLLVGPVLLAIFLAALRIYRREFAKIQ